ncbi:unnamed protein product [Dovyalis caffra]|uniref:Uncharacterized protein n=1 Tax=Dovyalis caffra TaxID=77055 RepID=A0AAV1S1G8_9ROSI|nr:unnamed protein product [Dovyalis caffra]
MSITRSTSELKIPAPPPSPIPTGRGSRSAANEILIEYLEQSLNVPDLALPEPCIPLNKHQNIPVEINYRLLESRDWESKDRLLESVKEFGVFKVIDHGISVEEMGFLVKEADRVFRVMEPKNVGFRRNYQQKEIVWVLSGEERMELAGEFVGAERFRDFSEKMENVASKLEAIAQQLYKFLVENTDKEHFGKTMTMQGKESILSLFRHNHRNDIELEQQMLNEKNRKCSDHILRLHFPTTQSQFSLRTDQGPLCFDAGPDAIVVTVGKHLQKQKACNSAIGLNKLPLSWCRATRGKKSNDEGKKEKGKKDET